MKYIKKIAKWAGILILALLVIANLAIIFSGRLYIYKGIANTYFRGHVRPTIYDLDVFTNRTVEKGIAQPWVEADYIAKTSLSNDQRKLIESLNPASFLVAWGDTLIYEEYWGEHNETKVGNSFSMGKSIVSLLIGVALDEGKIKSLDEPVANYLPEFNDEKKEITIRHILTMSSGLSWSESYVSPFCDVAELYYDTDDRDLALNRRTIEEPPGKTFKYKSGDTQVLMYILAAATGQNVSTYASEKLWKKMGAESEAFWSLADDEKSAEKAFCCFYSTSRDFLRLGKLINQRGKWNGEQLVSAAYVDEFSSPAPLIKGNGKPNDLYGFQYWIYSGLPYKVTYFRGMSGQYIISIPSKQLVIVRTGMGTKPNWKNTPQKTKKGLEGHYEELLDYIHIGLEISDQANS